MTAESSSLFFSRRIIIVTGKGGTGKTTVTAALGWAAAHEGLSTLLVEVGAFEQLPRLITGQREAPVGYEGRLLRPGIQALRIEPFAALAEYLGMQLGSKRLVAQALRNRSLRQLLRGAPGWRELITLGKIWQLEQMQRPNGKPLYDLILVDAPATGHGLTFLDIPHVARSAVRSGPLARNARRVEELIQDPDRTQILPVSLAEELPAQETSELVERLRRDLGLDPDRVVVNAVAPPVPYPNPAELERSLRGLPKNLSLARLPQPDSLADAVAHVEARHHLNQTYLSEIASRTGLPLVVLPLLDQGVNGPADLEVLAPALSENSESQQASSSRESES